MITKNRWMAATFVAVLLTAVDVRAQTAGPGPGSIGYARLGYGAVFGDRPYGGLAFGFGYRHEVEPVAVDVSFLNFQLPSSGEGDGSPYDFSGSLLKVQALHFMNSEGDGSMYLGGGFSYGFTNVGTPSDSIGSGGGFSKGSWSGGGLQGELTIGYEQPRPSAIRAFIEVNATVPFYNASSQWTTYSAAGRSTVSIVHRFAPSVAVSVGVGWGRSHTP